MKVSIQSFLTAKTASEVIDLIENLQDHAKTRPVGGREGNLATINMGSDPAAGIIERITNAIDAVIEKEWIENRKPITVKSPRQAAELWFNLKDDEWQNQEFNKAWSEVAENVEVTLWDSGNSDRPTVDIRDRGIGLKGDEFEDTILSLNSSVKVNKMFVAGAFGQGGSTALSYSQFTIIVSKKWNPNGSDSGEAAATIVYFDPKDVNTDKHGVYEYFVSSLST